MSFILLVISSVFSNFSSFTQKKYSVSVGGDREKEYIYTIGVAFFASLIYLVIAKFRIFSNTTALLTGIFYGFVCAAYTVLAFIAFSKMNLLSYSIFRNSSFIITWLFGLVFLKENVSVSSVIAILLICITVILPVFNKTESNKKNTLSAYILGFLLMIFSATSSIIVKIFSSFPDSSPQTNSIMLFYTNVFMGVFSVVFLIMTNIQNSKGGSTRTMLQVLKPSYIWLLIPICNILQISSTLFTMHVQKTMPLSIYTILSTGIGGVTLFIISKVFFREKATRLDIIAWILSLIATVITIF